MVVCIILGVGENYKTLAGSCVVKMVTPVMPSEYLRCMMTLVRQGKHFPLNPTLYAAPGYGQPCSTNEKIEFECNPQELVEGSL